MIELFLFVLVILTIPVPIGIMIREAHRRRCERLSEQWRGFEVKSTTGETPVPLKKENDHG